MNNIQREDIFSTAIWKSPLPNFDDHKQVFLSALREKRKLDPTGVYKSNYGGYQSADDLVLCDELSPFFHFLMNVMVPSIINDCSMKVSSGMISQCWANFNDKLNTLNMPHTHSGVLSGVFYINLPEGSGKLVLPNKNSNHLWKGWQLIDFNRENIGLNPYVSPQHSPEIREGWIYVWHSHLEHYVTPNMIDVERVSVSFNIDLHFNQEPQAPAQIDK